MAPTTVSATKAMTLPPPNFVNFAFEFFSQAGAIGLPRLAGTPAAIFVDRRHMMRFDQQWIEMPALPSPLSDRESAERNAVIALATCDDVTSAAARPVRRNIGARA